MTFLYDSIQLLNVHNACRINPHYVMEMTTKDQEEIEDRGAQGIARFVAVSQKGSSHCGYENGARYDRPHSRYQKWMRAKMGKDGEVKYHYTAEFSALIVERCVTLRVLRGSLPTELTLSNQPGHAMFL